MVKLPISEIISTILQELFINKKKSLILRQTRYKYQHKIDKGSLVWLYIAPVSRLSICWQGPYIVVEKLGTTCFTVAPVLAKGRPLFVHESRLRPCHADMSLLKYHVGNVLLSEEDVAELADQVDLATNFTDPLGSSLDEFDDVDIEPLDLDQVEPFLPDVEPDVEDEITDVVIDSLTVPTEEVQDEFFNEIKGTTQVLPIPQAELIAQDVEVKNYS